MGARDGRTQSTRACLFFFPSLQTHPLPSPLWGVLLALNLTLSANHSVSIWGSHIFHIISKNSSNKVTQLYWMIIFIPPIYTQTIVKWVAKEGERTTTQTPTLPFTPNPFPKKPKNLNPNTLFFFFSYTKWVPVTVGHNLPPRGIHTCACSSGVATAKHRQR